MAALSERPPAPALRPTRRSSLARVRFSYDSESDAAYVRLIEESRSAKQIVVEDDQLWNPIVIDLDSEGHVIGFEVLSASEMLPPHVLDEFR